MTGIDTTEILLVGSTCAEVAPLLVAPPSLDVGFGRGRSVVRVIESLC